jgi:hypothetical protein
MHVFLVKQGIYHKALDGEIHVANFHYIDSIVVSLTAGKYDERSVSGFYQFLKYN